jgi:FixJ family two-component response regulator
MTSAPGMVFIIDDDAGVRTATQRLLKSVGLNAEVFASPQDFLKRKRPDVSSCLILDVRLPNTSGLEVQRKLVEAGVHIPIIFITAYADVPMSVKAMKSGAVEFLTKPVRDQDLVDAIRQALDRDRRVRQEQNEMAELRRRYERLTPRERQVMRLVALGMPTKQIASVLGTSKVTAKVHRSQMMHKMQAESLVELGRIAERLKIPAKE